MIYKYGKARGKNLSSNWIPVGVSQLGFCITHAGNNFSFLSRVFVFKYFKSQSANFDPTPQTEDFGL